MGLLVFQQLTIVPQLPVQLVAQEVTPTVEPEPTIDEDAVWLVVQAWRTKNNLQEYKKNDVLCGYALERSEQLQTDFSHTPFMKMSARVMKETGMTMVAENLSEGVQYPDQVLLMWLNSPSHRANLDYRYTDSCIKCSENFCAQVFAR